MHRHHECLSDPNSHNLLRRSNMMACWGYSVNIKVLSKKSEEKTPKDKTIFVIKCQRIVRTWKKMLFHNPHFASVNLVLVLWCSLCTSYNLDKLLWLCETFFIFSVKRKKPYLLYDIYSSKKFPVKMAVTQEVHYCYEKVTPPKLGTFCRNKRGKLCYLNKLCSFFLEWTKRNTTLCHIFGK